MATDSPAPLPPLPDPLEPDTIQDLDDAALSAALETISAAERATKAAMAPYDRQLAELRARSAEIATERRRRERSARSAQRKAVRTQAASGDMPSLPEALADEDGALPEGMRLADLPAFLRTGGQIGFGFATKPGVITLTDGRQQKLATTWGEARKLFAAGWELGTATLPGVRIHLAGTRVERVVEADQVAIQVAPAVP